ncbi:MAG: cyclic nucleotide-binding domain-containing protein [Bdellovibrionia bacterium]
MNPSSQEIAAELKSYDFFASFDEELLLAFAAIVQHTQFATGTVILKEGQLNKRLYFLRSGSLEISLGEETIAILQKPGEVFGEMSVVSQKEVSTTVRAITKVQCYYVEADSFASMEPAKKSELESLMFRVYSVILSQRLAKTNKKARLFEITSRELFHDREMFKRGAEGDVLLIDSDKGQRNTAKLALSSSGVTLEVAESIEQAKAILAHKNFHVIICEEKFVDFLKECSEAYPDAHLILLASVEMKQKIDLLLKMDFINNVVTRDPADKQSVIRAILTTSTKILKNDLFGMEKYLTWGADIKSKQVINSTVRDQLKEEMISHLKGFGIRQSILDRVNTVAEEMLMNAIYDAPTDVDGKSLFNHLSRKNDVYLEAHQQSQLNFGCDGKYVGISVEDPFGALPKQTILKYLKSCYEGHAGSLNADKGGAGRGLHQIIENADITIFNVKQNVRTEVICLFNLDPAKDREQVPTFHYFYSV